MSEVSLDVGSGAGWYLQARRRVAVRRVFEEFRALGLGSVSAITTSEHTVDGTLPRIHPAACSNAARSIERKGSVQ